MSVLRQARSFHWLICLTLFGVIFLLTQKWYCAVCAVVLYSLRQLPQAISLGKAEYHCTAITLVVGEYNWKTPSRPLLGRASFVNARQASHASGSDYSIWLKIKKDTWKRLLQPYKSRRSLVCNPTKSECNHFRKKMYVINPKRAMPYACGDYIPAYAVFHTNPSDWIKKRQSNDCLFFGGRGWIRTTEVSDNRFTVCPLWPLGNSPLWSWWSESNQQPADYKSAALPLSHTSMSPTHISLYIIA